jgi:hypothetical protein
VNDLSAARATAPPATRRFSLPGLLFSFVALSLANASGADAPADPNAGPAATKITGLFDGAGHPINADAGKPSSVGLNDELWVQLSAPPAEISPPLDVKRYALYLNGSELTGLVATRFDPEQHALVFRLKRSDDNAAVWAAILGSPAAFHAPVRVSVGEKAAQEKTFRPTIQGEDADSTFQLQVISGWRLSIATVVVLVVAGLVFGRARHSTTLRDNLLPQVEPIRQPYSLGRWQMAFWFTLVFASFIFLLFLLGDYNTISSQALALMGISGATALAAVAVDDYKDTPADAANRGLRALGLHSYADVARVKQELVDRQTELHANESLTKHRILQLQAEILDRQILLRTYDDAIRPFVTEGWFKDLTTDLNGSALHRLQVFCWTWVLGGVFIFGVYRDLAMPNFSATLLALMAISSAGYVGFKFPEAQS